MNYPKFCLSGLVACMPCLGQGPVTLNPQPVAQSQQSIQTELLKEGARVSLITAADGGLALRRQALQPERDGLRPAGATLLWKGPQALFPDFGRLAFLRLPGGAFVASTSRETGSGANLDLWTGSLERSDALHQQVPHVLLPPDSLGQPRRGTNLQSSSLVRFQDSILLFGSMWSSDQTPLTTTKSVFSCTLGSPQESPLRARELAPGDEPRVLVLGQQLILAVRRPGNALEARTAAPLVLLRSGDAETWVPMDTGSSQLKVDAKYEMIAQAGALYLGTRTQGDDAAIQLYRNALDGAPWSLVESVPTSQVAPSAKGFWLQAATGSSRPDILVRNANGVVRRR